jgi:hypothetical protein
MRVLRHKLLVTILLFATATTTRAQISFKSGLDSVIGARVRVRLEASMDPVAGSLEAVGDSSITVRQHDIALQLPSR